MALLKPADHLAPLVYEELRALAARHLVRERRDHTLQPTALVHEVYLRLVDHERVKNRSHFLALAARAIHRILVDHARGHDREKRGRDWVKITLHDEHAVGGDPALELLALDEALKELRELDERQAEVVELRFFGGLTIDEVAEVLELSPRTVDNEWRSARAWLRRRLG